MRRLFESFLRRHSCPSFHQSNLPSKLNPRLFPSVCGLEAIWPASRATGTPWRGIPSRTSFSSQTPITIESQPCGCLGKQNLLSHQVRPCQEARHSAGIGACWGCFCFLSSTDGTKAGPQGQIHLVQPQQFQSLQLWVCRRSGKAISIQLIMVCRLDLWEGRRCRP